MQNVHIAERRAFLPQFLETFAVPRHKHKRLCYARQAPDDLAQPPTCRREISSAYDQVCLVGALDKSIANLGIAMDIAKSQNLQHLRDPCSGGEPADLAEIAQKRQQR